MSKRKGTNGFVAVVIIVATLLAGAVLGDSFKGGKAKAEHTVTNTPTVGQAADEHKTENTKEPGKGLDAEVHFIDVGQGDSILIEAGNEFMLIDAGENDQGDRVVAYLKEQKVKKLAYVIGTHPHSDHIGGLDTVIRSFEVEHVILPPVNHTTKTYKDVLLAVEKKGLKVTKPVVGTKYALSHASFVIIAPNADYKDNLNDWSVGIKFTNGDNSFVMCGDAEIDAEYDMCENGIDLKAQVLKLSHHGSDTSNSEALFKAVQPEFAVISCGKDNSYGHPHHEIMERLKKLKIPFFRTDEKGTIVASSDGSHITWNHKPSTDYISGAQTNKEENETQQQVQKEETYIINMGTKKFHRSDCAYAKDISEKNRKESTLSREELIKEGYEPCKVCQP